MVSTIGTMPRNSFTLEMIGSIRHGRVEADLTRNQPRKDIASLCRRLPFLRICGPRICRDISLIRSWPIFKQIFAVAEGEDLLRTDLDTGGGPAVFQSRVVAEDAFLDHRIERAGIAVCRHIEGAGDHAVAATDADLRDCRLPPLPWSWYRH